MSVSCVGIVCRYRVSVLRIGEVTLKRDRASG
jgi:hypothetical protein